MKTKEKYSTLKLILRIATLIISVWALIVAYQSKQIAEWVNDKQDNIIEEFLFSK